LVVWNMFYFSIYWECHHPTWRTPSFFWGVETSNQMENAIQSDNCGVGNRQKKPYAAGFPPCIRSLVPCWRWLDPSLNLTWWQWDGMTSWEMVMI
jgi:hypothetical protein